jgi:DNA-binding HxlR family transcriptional regulator
VESNQVAAIPSYDPYTRDCPAREALDLIGDRWTVLILGCLSRGPRRHSEIARRIEGISPKMLTQTLRGLERDGLVTRTVHAVVPPRVDYELTQLGQSLGTPLAALEAWAVAHVGQMRSAREAYDASRS